MFGSRKTTSGVIGLGIVGSQVALNLRAAKVHVYTWNRTPKSQPNFLGSPAEMAERTDTIQIFVTTGDALEEVVKAFLPKLTKRHIILNHSTIGLEEVRRIGAMVEKTGAAFLDAPFTGSRVAAGAGELVYYIGGDPKVLHKIKPLLEISSSQILHFGEIGSATLLKLATNLISASTVQALSEAAGLCAAEGIKLHSLKEAIEVNACRSPLVDMKLPTIMDSDFDPHFSLKNMSKDSLYALEVARAHGMELPGLSGVASAMAEALRAGGSDLDFSVLAERYLNTPSSAESRESEAESV